MTILITGSSGFLGSALSNYLTKKGLECIKATRKNIIGSETVKNYKDIPEADIIIHLAQCNDRNFVNKQNRLYVEENIETMKYLMNKKYKKFIYISSSIVYGDKFKSPRKVSDRIEPYDKYSEIKIKCENIVRKEKGNILRLSNIYGPGMSNKNVLSKIIEKVKNNEIIQLNNGSSIRDFIWIKDAIQAIFKFIELDIDNSIFNVGSGQGTSIEELINTILLVYKKDLPIVYENNKECASSIILEISETKNKLKWEPKINLKDGLYYIMEQNIDNL